MQTYTTKNQQLDLTKLINKQTNEPIIIKNNLGNNFLLMPFSTENVQDILKFYKSYSSLTNRENILNIEEEVSPEMSAEEFVEKWTGTLKDSDIENWKEDRYNYLMEKHK